MNETLNTVPKQEAIDYIVNQASSQGLETWKTFYKGQMVSNPGALPDNVVLSDLRISPIMDQA